MFIFCCFGLFSWQSFNGKKWEKFNSEKVASLAYARIQGRVALISHFQNSSLMNEDKRCRPILFHCEGLAAGIQVLFFYLFSNFLKFYTWFFSWFDLFWIWSTYRPWIWAIHSWKGSKYQIIWNAWSYLCLKLDKKLSKDSLLNNDRKHYLTTRTINEKMHILCHYGKAW